MADAIDSLTVRYEADIRPYLRDLKQLEAETDKSLSKLERRYGALLSEGEFVVNAEAARATSTYWNEHGTNKLPEEGTCGTL
jgi:hypothetical protein